MTVPGLVPAKTALVVIDLQKGIAAFPTQPYPSAQVVRNTVRIAEAVRAGGGFVVFVRVTGSADGRDMLTPDCDAPMGAGVTRTSDWADLLPELGVTEGDHILTKRQWGAFYGTDLDLQLRRRGLDRIILTGIATCFGVESTARAAYELGYAQVFAEDAMTSLTAEGHTHTVSHIFPRLGRVRSTTDIVAALEASAKS